MTDKEIMQMALDWADEHLRVIYGMGGATTVSRMTEWTAVFRARLAQPEWIATTYVGDGQAERNVYYDEAKQQPEQEPQYKLICPTCKADRTKVDCQGNRMNCGLKFEAFGVQPDIQPTAWAIYAIPSSDNPIDVTMDAEVLDEIANPVKPLYTAPPQREWQGLTDEDWIIGKRSADYIAGAEWAEAKLKEKNG